MARVRGVHGLQAKVFIFPRSRRVNPERDVALLVGVQNEVEVVLLLFVLFSDRVFLIFMTVLEMIEIKTISVRQKNDRKKKKKKG